MLFDKINEDSLVNVEYHPVVPATEDDEEKIRQVVELDIEEAGRTARAHLVESFYNLAVNESTLYRHLIENMSPDTRTPLQKFKARIRGRIEKSKIWLSKKIYDWSGYEDYD